MNLASILLIAPSVNEGITVKQSLSRRHSVREFSSEPLSIKNLSEVFWAMYGINRPEEGKRTAPSALALYPLELYAIMPEGIYRYNPELSVLEPCYQGDARKETCVQDFAQEAPLNIAVFANYEVYDNLDEDIKAVTKGHECRMASLDAGAATENAYLYCTCAGINIVERMMFDGEKLKELCGLPSTDHFIVGITLGYPPEK